MRKEEIESLIFENSTKKKSSFSLENSNVFKAKKIRDGVYIFWIDDTYNMFPKIKYHFNSNGTQVKKRIKMSLKPFIFYVIAPLIVGFISFSIYHNDYQSAVYSIRFIGPLIFLFILLLHLLGYYLV